MIHPAMCARGQVPNDPTRGLGPGTGRRGEL